MVMAKESISNGESEGSSRAKNEGKKTRMTIAFDGGPLPLLQRDGAPSRLFSLKGAEK